MGKDILAALPRGGFPSTKTSAAAASSGVVEFGWDEEKSAKLTGRRKKQQKKIKPGSFGARRRAAGWRRWAATIAPLCCAAFPA